MLQHHRCLSHLHAVGSGIDRGKHISQLGNLVGKGVVRINGLAIECNNSVTLPHANLSGRSATHHRVSHTGQERTHKRRLVLNHREEIKFATEGNAHRFACTDDIHPLGLANLAEEVGTEVFELTLLSAHEDVAVAESESLGFLIELHTVSHVLHGDIRIAPCEENHRIDEEGKEEVEKHSANHDKQALPCRM